MRDVMKQHIDICCFHYDFRAITYHELVFVVPYERISFKPSVRHINYDCNNPLLIIVSISKLVLDGHFSALHPLLVGYETQN